jgi:hypothetical protein
MWLTLATLANLSIRRSLLHVTITDYYENIYIYKPSLLLALLSALFFGSITFPNTYQTATLKT